jgi:hypothetical protein
MRHSRKFFAGLGILALSGAIAAFATDVPVATDTAEPVVNEGDWHIRASGARIIGGYGDNFAYDGENVRPLDGRAEAHLNPEKGTGEIVIELETTPRSGPIRFSEDQSWTGEIRIVQKLNTARMDKARIAQEVYLHGDTGNEAPVMPRIYNYFATWGPAKIFVNGEEVIPMIGSHTMFTEQARGANDKIVKGDQVYSPRLPDKTGFTNPRQTEFHFVSHTTEPDPDNFPPHTGWIHLHFSEVNVVEKPAGVEIPHVAE